MCREMHINMELIRGYPEDGSYYLQNLWEEINEIWVLP